MESLKKLKDVAEECLKDIKAIESKISVSEGNLSFLESKKTTLMAEITDLENKKSAVQAAVGLLERDSLDKIDVRMREVRAKEEEVTALRADLKTKLFQADSAKTEGEQAREKYAVLYSEYLAKSQALDEKKQAIMDAAK